MVKINNNQIGKKISDEMRASQSIDPPPMRTSDAVVLNYQVNDPLFYGDRFPIIRHGALADAVGPTLIYTVPANKVFYLTSAMFSGAVGSTNTSDTSILFTSDPISNDTVILDLRWQAGTASNQTQQVSYSYPIKFSPGSTFSILTDGSVTFDIELGCVITGFEMFTGITGV